MADAKKCIVVATRLLVVALLATGCMPQPKDGQVLSAMGAKVKFTAVAYPNTAVQFEVALHQRGASGYTVTGWKPVGTCTTQGSTYTDVKGRTWASCSIETELPATDCAAAGSGVWYGNFATPGDGQRFANVRGLGNGAPLWMFPSTVTNGQLIDVGTTSGGFAVVQTYATGVEAQLISTTPQFGSSDLAGSGDATDVEVRGDLAVVARANGSGPELVLVDVANPGAPQVLGSREIGATVNDVAIEGHWAFLATDDPTAEVQVVDINHRNDPVQVGTADLGGPALSIAVAGRRVVVGRAANASAELLVYFHDIAAPGTLIPEGTYQVGADVNAIDITRDLAFLATNHPSKKFQVIDVADPSHMVERGASSMSSSGGAALGVDYHAGKLYGVRDVAAGTADFLIYSVAPDGALTQLGALELGTRNTGVNVYAGRALVSTTTPSKALSVVDVTNAMAPSRISVSPATAGANGVGVRNGIAHLAMPSTTNELAVVSSGAGFEPVITDINDDAHVTIACLGDSNTAVTFAFSPWCLKIADCFQSSTGTPPAWCADPGTVGVPRPSWTTIDQGYGLAAAQHISAGNDIRDGFEQMSLALCSGDPPSPPVCPEHPYQLDCNVDCVPSDAVVLALGSVDGLLAGCGAAPTPPGHADVEPALDALMQLAERANYEHSPGARAFYVLAPPICDDGKVGSCPSDATCCGPGVQGVCCCCVPGARQRRQEAIQLLNNRLRHEVPRELLIDFDTPVMHPSDCLTDGVDYVDRVHIAGPGQEKRARAALSKLRD